MWQGDVAGLEPFELALNRRSVLILAHHGPHARSAHVHRGADHRGTHLHGGADHCHGGIGHGHHCTACAQQGHGANHGPQARAGPKTVYGGCCHMGRAVWRALGHSGEMGHGNGV